MKLTSKLALPPLVALALIIAGLHFYWMPFQLKKAKQGYEKQTHDILISAESSLIRDLLEENLAALYANIEYLQQEHEGVWFNLEVYNGENKRIFPLFVGKKATSEDGYNLIHCEHPLLLEGSKLGRIVVDVNWTDKKQEIESQIKGIRNMIIALLLLSIFVTFFAQIQIISRPINRLCEATKKISGGELYISPPAIVGRDEIGILAQGFNAMLRKLQALFADLQKKKQFQEQLLNAMSTFVAVLKPDGEVIFVNNTLLKVGGLKMEDIIGKKFFDAPWWTHSDEIQDMVITDIVKDF